jgi:hypothetical protein
MERGNCLVCSLPEAEAHHLDYDRPLDIMWFCRVHHMEYHRKNQERFWL